MRLEQLKQQIDEGTTLHGTMDRDLHTWWNQFNESYAALDRDMNDETLCQQREDIKQRIDHLIDLLDKVNSLFIYCKFQ